MSTLTEQITQLEAAIAAQETLRPTLGDAAVDAVIASLRAQMATLRKPLTSSFEAQLAQLERADLIRLYAQSPEVEYWFKHALTQEAAYGSLLHAERLAIHRRVAQCYETLFADRLDEWAAELAYHYAQAGDHAKIAHYSLRAAESAARIFADVEASQHYARAFEALRHLPDSDEHRRQRVDSIVRYVELAWGSANPEQQFALLAEAEMLARSMRNHDNTQGGSLRLARTHLMMAALHLARGDYRAVPTYSSQVLAQADALGHPTFVITPSAQLGAALLVQGHFAHAIPYLMRAAELTEEMPNRWEWPWCVGFLAIAHAMLGNRADALAQVGRAISRMAENAYLAGSAQAHSYLLVVCFALGDLTRLLHESEFAIELATQSGHPLYAALAYGFQALALSRSGQHDAARRSMSASREVGARVGGQFMLSDWLAAAYAEIAFNEGEYHDALTQAEHIVTAAQATDALFAPAWAQRVWGQALWKLQEGLTAEVEGHLKESLRLFETGDAKLEAARTHVIWGRLCRARGDAEAARAHWQKAAEQFEASGLMDELERTRALLA